MTNTAAKHKDYVDDLRVATDALQSLRGQLRDLEMRRADAHNKVDGQFDEERAPIAEAESSMTRTVAALRRAEREAFDEEMAQ